MLTLKYLFLPFLWSLLPSISPYSVSIIKLYNQLSTINLTNKNHFPEVGVYQYGGKSFLNVPHLGPFPWNTPNHRISFIEMQKANAQPQAEEPNGPLKTIIEYQAKDSITFDIRQKNFNIYGAGIIGYEDTELTAENISLNWSNNTIIATGQQNELGKINHKPVFQQGNTKYIAEEIRYNFESKRGTARRLFTKLDETIIRCRKAKIDTEDTYYADRIKFTSCNLTKPHYFIKARNIKFVKDKRIASGPFQFYFDGVPTILGFFYGIFYMPTTRISGIIRPQIGEDGEKGFFLKEGGYYFYFNDYIDLALKGSLYSKGHSVFMASMNYKKRYGYSGNLEYHRAITSHTRETALEEDKEQEWKFKWKHNTKDNTLSSLTAEVDIQSRSSRHSLQQREEPDKLNAKTQSKVRYIRKLLGTPYSLNSSLSHSKDFQSNLTHITVPQVMLSTTPIYIFRWGSATPKHWYEDVYLKHTSEFQSEFTNAIGKDTLEFSRQNWPKFLRESRYGAKHTFPIETNIKFLTYFNLKPSFQYTERWYFKKLEYRYDTEQDTMFADTVKSFNRVWDYSVGTELQTTIYGTHFFSEEFTIQGIRHRMEPSVGFSYTPDRAEYWQKISTKQGEKIKDKFENAVYGTPRNKASGLLNVKVDNTLEIKVRNIENAQGKSKKISIFESLNINTSYDFLADTFKLGDINVGARTRLLDSLISVEYSATFDPYMYCFKNRIEEFAWQHGQGLGTMKKYALKVGTTLKSKQRSNEALDKAFPEKALTDKPPVKQPSLPVVLDSNQYIDFDVPWHLSLSYQQNYTYQIEKDKKETTRQLVLNGDISITRNWKINFSSTYDLDKKELVGSATRLGIYRDLHCWQMSFDWVPLANRQSYEFSIGLKAPMLQDLKLPHSREYDKL